MPEMSLEVKLGMTGWAEVGGEVQNYLKRVSLPSFSSYISVSLDPGEAVGGFCFSAAPGSSR